MTLLEDLKAKAQAAPTKELFFAEKSFGYQILEEHGLAMFTWKPEVWNDVSKGQQPSENQKLQMAMGKFIAAANPANILRLIEAIEVMRNGLKDIFEVTENPYDRSDEDCAQWAKEALAKAEELLK